MPSSLQFRLICVDPPITTAVKFGLQDKERHLREGTPLPNGSLRFDFELDVKQHTDGSPNFTGAYAHGSRQQRFLYLTLMSNDGTIIRRTKVQLGDMTWAQVEQVNRSDGLALQASVGGQHSGTVPLLDDGWIVCPRD